jgi:hypothetical protein
MGESNDGDDFLEAIFWISAKNDFWGIGAHVE